MALHRRDGKRRFLLSNGWSGRGLAATMTLVAALALISCSGTRDYTRPTGVSPEQARRDVQECESEVRLVPRPPQNPTTARYGSPAPSDPKLGYRDALDQDVLFRRCMESKGYTGVR